MRKCDFLLVCQIKCQLIQFMRFMFGMTILVLLILNGN